MNRYHGPASWTFSINWLLRGIVFLVQSVPKEGLNWPKLTNVCKLCKVESVLPIVTASQQKRKKKLDKCIQTQWSVLPTVAVSQQARPFYIRDDYLSQHTKGNNWLRRFVITCRQTIGGRLLCIMHYVVFFSHIFNSSTETNKPMELVFKMKFVHNFPSQSSCDLQCW